MKFSAVALCAPLALAAVCLGQDVQIKYCTADNQCTTQSVLSNRCSLLKQKTLIATIESNADCGLIAGLRCQGDFTSINAGPNTLNPPYEAQTIYCFPPKQA
ncbi:hypothetical protein GGI12_002452 [Dipsacomyces acuminosporus]|nr:hypothetical protein GGI12_002452 [Dipsacomyces acuminosporus]